ncbi:MAG: hypothetical protein ACXWOW_04705 [Candidatus Limnocylindrales bacterium]
MRMLRIQGGFVAAALVLILAAAAGLAFGSARTPTVTAGTAALNGAADQAASVSGPDFEAALAAAGFSLGDVDPQGGPSTYIGRGFAFGRGFGVFGLGGAIVHVEGTLQTRAKGLITFALDHGTAAGVSDTSLTVAEAGGASVTVALNADTKIALRGVKNAKGSAIPKDAQVFVLSQKQGNGWLAMRIIVVVPRPAASPKPGATTAPSGGPTTAPSSSSSGATPSSGSSPTSEPTPTSTSSPSESAPSAAPTGGGSNG